MSGGASILALPEYQDEDEVVPSRVRSAYKPAVSLSAKSKIEVPKKTSVYDSIPTPGQLEFYARLRRGGMSDEEIMSKYPELTKIKEKKDRDRMIQEMANRPEPME